MVLSSINGHDVQLKLRLETVIISLEEMSHGCTILRRINVGLYILYYSSLAEVYYLLCCKNVYPCVSSNLLLTVNELF